MKRHLTALTALALAIAAARADEPARTSLKPLPPEQWSAAHAAHLLRRAGFGGSPEEVRRAAEMGLDAAVDRLIDLHRTPYQPAPVAVDPLVLEPVDRAELRAMTEEERRQYQERRRRAERRTFEETRLWWLERMLESPRPLEEKMTLFWHGHFTSGIREVRNPIFMKEQNELLRRRALDNFGELLRGVSRDRAMLTYLDGNRNVAGAPNENYGRELLELFTLGVGNYRESDIKAAARAFTGWTFNDQGFVFRRRNHDFDPKTFLGRTGKWDGDDVIAIILEQPACARHLARRLLEFFCRPDPEKALVEALAREIRSHRYELAPTMRTLLRSQAFHHPASRGCLVKSPVEVVIGTARQLGVGIENLFEAERQIAAMGQELMQPPNVKGWDGGAAWINTATLFHRYNAVGALIHGAGGPARGERRRAAADAAAGNDEVVMIDGASIVPPGESAAMTPVARIGRSRQPAYDPRPVLEAHGLLTAGDVVDFYAAHLLAVPLDGAKRETLVRYLAGEGTSLVPGDRGALDRVRTMIHLLCSTPEFQMN